MVDSKRNSPNWQRRLLRRQAIRNNLRQFLRVRPVNELNELLHQFPRLQELPVIVSNRVLPEIFPRNGSNSVVNFEQIGSTPLPTNQVQQESRRDNPFADPTPDLDN